MLKHERFKGLGALVMEIRGQTAPVMPKLRMTIKVYGKERLVYIRSFLYVSSLRRLSLSSFIASIKHRPSVLVMIVVILAHARLWL